MSRLVFVESWDIPVKDVMGLNTGFARPGNSARSFYQPLYAVVIVTVL